MRHIDKSGSAAVMFTYSFFFGVGRGLSSTTRGLDTVSEHMNHQPIQNIMTDLGAVPPWS
jgi:hypothetical protein